MIVAHALYLISPAVAAGVVHGVVIKYDLLALLARPIDGGVELGGAPLFGANKTWRGPIVMVGASSAAAAAFGLPVALGACLGAAYSLAELPNSFLKRRLGIAPGSRTRRRAVLQYIVDQGDSAAGCTLALGLFVHTPELLAVTFAAGFAIHAIFDALLYALGVKPLQEQPV